MSLKRSRNVLAFPRRARYTRHTRWHAAVAALDARVDELEQRLGGKGRTRASLPTRTRLRTALIVSLLVHAFILYGVTVRLPERIRHDDKAPQLEIVLVNAKSAVAPSKADVLAQHDLDGGGNTDEKRRAQSPLPALADQKPEAEVTLALRRVERLEHEAKDLLTQTKSKTVMETAPPGAKSQPENQLADAPQAPDIMQRSLEIARLEAQIARDWNAYQERPRKRFVGARAQEVRFARYVDDWRQKIERVGDINYPQAARDDRLQGRLLVTVGIKSDGTLEGVDINRPSGHKVLDEAARRIVELAAPFAPFPATVSKDTDVLYITRWWTFTSSDHFQSE